MPNDISSQQASTVYQWAVQTYGAQAADKAAEDAGLAGADQAQEVGSGNLSISGVTVDQMGHFYADLGVKDAGTPPEVSTSQGAQLEHLLEQSISGNESTFLARAMLTLVNEQRHENVLTQMQNGMAGMADLMAAADKLDKEASETRSAALVTLVTTVVSAAVSIGATAVSSVGKMASIGQEMKAMRQQMKAGEELAEVNQDLKTISRTEEKFGGMTSAMKSTETDLLATKADLEKQIGAAKLAIKAAQRDATGFGLIGQVGDGAGKIISAAGEFNSRNVDADVKNLEADSKRLEAEAQYFNTAGDMAKARADALNELASRIITFQHDQLDATSERFRTFSRA